MLIDQKMKFLGFFEKLFTKTSIDHHTTSQGHLEADGWVEHVVQTIKQGLHKYDLLHDNHHDWNHILP